MKKLLTFPSLPARSPLAALGLTAPAKRRPPAGPSSVDATIDHLPGAGLGGPS